MEHLRIGLHPIVGFNYEGDSQCPGCVVTSVEAAFPGQTVEARRVDAEATATEFLIHLAAALDDSWNFRWADPAHFPEPILVGVTDT